MLVLLSLIFVVGIKKTCCNFGAPLISFGTVQEDYNCYKILKR